LKDEIINRLILRIRTGAEFAVPVDIMFFFIILKDENKIRLTQRIRTWAEYAVPVAINNNFKI